MIIPKLTKRCVEQTESMYISTHPSLYYCLVQCLPQHIHCSVIYTRVQYIPKSIVQCQGQLCGHVTCTQKGPTLDLMCCCAYLEILNFLSRGSPFSFCTGLANYVIFHGQCKYILLTFYTPNSFQHMFLQSLKINAYIISLLNINK